MLDRLKAVFFDTRRPEEVALTSRVERAIEAMPPTLATKTWRRWVDSLPITAREEAVWLRQKDPSLPEQREASVRAITRLSRLRLTNPEVAERDLEALKREMSDREKEFHERKKRFADHWGEPPRDP